MRPSILFLHLPLFQDQMAYPLYGVVGALVVFAFVAQRLAKYVVATRFQKAHGCKPARQIPQWDRILGYDLYKSQVNASKNKQILKVAMKRYEDNGITWSAVMMGSIWNNTIDPENIKAVLATNFKDFGLGQRHQAFGPLLGRGIFTTDGGQWEHSRVGILLSITRAVRLILHRLS
jgi:hypothetical protein